MLLADVLSGAKTIKLVLGSCESCLLATKSVDKTQENANTDQGSGECYTVAGNLRHAAGQQVETEPKPRK